MPGEVEGRRKVCREEWQRGLQQRTILATQRQVNPSFTSHTLVQCIASANRAQLPDHEVPKEEGTAVASVQHTEETVKQRKKTMAELDEELKLKLEGVSGEGGTAGVEYEAGKAVGLKRGVKENMFRII